MNTDLLITLKNYWFSEKEAKIYLTTLELGENIASTIARNAWIQRATTYTILKELIKKWYMNKVIKNDVNYFVAISPNIIVNQLEEKYIKFKEKLPDFLSIFNKYSNKTRIQVFENKEWLKNLFSEFATTTVDMKTILWTPKWENNKILLEYANYYRKKRKQKWLISKRIMSSHNVSQKKEQNNDKKYGRETLILDDLPFDIQADINIFWPGKVSFLFFENKTPYAVMIDNPHMYQALNALFDYIRNSQKNK